jgi:hypothetical protein
MSLATSMAPATARRQRRQATPAATPTRLNVRLGAEAAKRLHLHALMADMTPGQLIERLITEHCREWRVQRNGADRAKPDGPGDVSQDGVSSD